MNPALFDEWWKIKKESNFSFYGKRIPVVSDQSALKTHQQCDCSHSLGVFTQSKLKIRQSWILIVQRSKIFIYVDGNLNICWQQLKEKTGKSFYGIPIISIPAFMALLRSKRFKTGNLHLPLMPGKSERTPHNFPPKLFLARSCSKPLTNYQSSECIKRLHAMRTATRIQRITRQSVCLLDGERYGRLRKEHKGTERETLLPDLRRVCDCRRGNRHRSKPIPDASELHRHRRGTQPVHVAVRQRQGAWQ